MKGTLNIHPLIRTLQTKEVPIMKKEEGCHLGHDAM